MKSIFALLATSVCILVAAQNPIFFGQNRTFTVSPGNPVSGMAVWFSADCVTYSGGSCSSPSNGTSITTWDDRSGNGNNLTSGTACPIATNVINGRPALGSVSSTLNCWYNLTSTISAGSTYSVFVVIERNSSTGKYDYFTGDTNSFKYFSGNTSSSKMQGIDKACSVAEGTGTTNADSSWHQMNVVFSGSAVTFRLDRAADGTGTVFTPSAVIKGIADGSCSSSERMDGYLAEAILYTTALSGTDVTTNETYLHNKYGL